MRTDNISYHYTLQVALQLLESLDTPRSLSVHMLAKYYLVDDYAPADFSSEMDAIGFNYGAYDQFSIDRLRDDYQATVLLSKLPAPDNDDPTLSVAAIDGFQKSEERNGYLNSLWLSESQVEARMALRGFDLSELRNIIRRLLGRAPSLQTLSDRGSWTEGSSVSLPLHRASSAVKCERGLTVTYPLAKALNEIRVNPLISQREGWLLVPGNLVDTVPKNIKTDRAIAKEPDINSFFQRAIGISVRERLLKAGIDLRDQRFNQAACETAFSCGRATIDLKDASNSLLLMVCYQLFPADWFNLIEVTRSPYGSLSTRKDALKGKAEWFEYQMLSSMGNGFTFELETLLFYAVCLAAGSPPKETFVYGDDIIVPQNCVSRVVDLLAICGFQVNFEKSFTCGAFFESCGLYSFWGVDVTPLKIKDLLYGPKECVTLANKVRMYAHSCRYYDGCDKRFLPAWRMCVHRLPRSHRRKCRGPLGSGITLFVNRNECDLSYSVRKGRLRCHQLTPVMKKKTAKFVGLLIFRLYESSTRSYSKFGLEQPKILSRPTKYGHRALDLTCRLDFSELNPIDRLIRQGNLVKELVTDGFRLSPLFVDSSSWYDLGPWS